MDASVTWEDGAMMSGEAVSGEAAATRGAAGGDDYVSARARMTDGERLAREMVRRRQQDAERSSRLYDAKRRTMGLDMEALDSQVQERKERAHYEKERTLQEDRDMLRVNGLVQQLEQHKRMNHRATEKAFKDYSLANHHAGTRREYELNDPNAMKKDLPVRDGDYDPRLGVSSMQVFSGEDLGRPERLKREAQAQALFVEQQKYEKAVMAEQARAKVVNDAEEIATVTAMQDAMDAQDRADDLAERKEQQAYNLDKAAGNARQKAEGKASTNAENDRELRFHAEDPFLNETGHGRQINGRALRDGFKGFDPNEQVQILRMQREQARQDVDKRTRDAAEQLAFERENELVRQQVMNMEKERQRQRRVQMEKLRQENMQLQKEQTERKKHMDTVVYTNTPTDDFFGQFGKSCR